MYRYKIVNFLFQTLIPSLCIGTAAFARSGIVNSIIVSTILLHQQHYEPIGKL